MYDSNRLFYRWICLCFAYLCCCVQVAEAASYSVDFWIKNVGSTNFNKGSFSIYRNGTLFLTVPWASGTLTPGNAANSGAQSILDTQLVGANWTAVFNAAGPWQGWKANAFAATSSFPVQSDGQTFTGTANNGAMVFEWGGAVASPAYRFDVVLRNDTYMGQTYYVRTNSVLTLTQRIPPGSTLSLTYTNVNTLFPVSIDNAGIYPPFTVTFPATPGDFWTPQDSTSIPVTVPHNMVGTGEAPGTNNFLVNAFTNSLGGTNAATDGTLISGFKALGGFMSQNSERELELLGQISTNIAALTNGMGNADILAGLEKVRTNSHHGPVADWAFENVVSLTSGMTSLVSGVANSVQGMVGLTAATNGIMSLTNGYSTNVSFTAVDSNFWTLRFGSHPTQYRPVLALFPTWSPLIADVASWIQFAIIWIAAYIVVQKMIELVHDFVFSVGAFTRSKSTEVVLGGQIIGTGASVGGSFWTHVPTAIVVVLSIMAGIVVITSAVSTLGAWGRIFSGLNPFTQVGGTFGGPVAQGLTLTAEFIPWGQLVIDLGAYAGFRLFMIAVGTGLIVWYQVVPLLMVAFGVQDAQAFNEFNIRNHSSAAVTVEVGGVAYVIGTNVVTRVDAPDGIDVSVSGGSSITNFSVGQDREVSLSIGDAGGAQFCTIRDAPGPMAAFWAGTQAGGIFGGIILSFWVIRLLKPGGETRLE